MAGSLDDLVRDLRKFDNRREVVKALRKRIREPLPAVRAAVKARALATLPKRGGLNQWVARTRVSAAVRVAGRSAGVKLKGSRKSAKGKSDLNRLDAGTVRHPSWGRRTPGSWHTQSVTPGYFTEPTTEVDQWRDACIRAVEDAVETIARG